MPPNYFWQIVVLAWGQVHRPPARRCPKLLNGGDGSGLLLSGRSDDDRFVAKQFREGIFDAGLFTARDGVRGDESLSRRRLIDGFDDAQFRAADVRNEDAWAGGSNLDGVVSDPVDGAALAASPAQLTLTLSDGVPPNNAGSITVR